MTFNPPASCGHKHEKLLAQRSVNSKDRAETNALGQTDATDCVTPPAVVVSRYPGALVDVYSRAVKNTPKHND